MMKFLNLFKYFLAIDNFAIFINFFITYYYNLLLWSVYPFQNRIREIKKKERVTYALHF